MQLNDSDSLKVKILVCCHKPDVVASRPPYMPIYVGAANSKCSLDMQRDDDGENISAKNASFCELTGLYWAWKNLKEFDIIGLCHYRRYFDFHNQSRRFLRYDVVKTKDFDNLDLSVPDSILKKVVNGAVVVAKPNKYPYSLACDYSCEHVSDDYNVLKQTVKELKSENDYLAFINVMERNNALSHYNMMLMNADNFNTYCEWLFTILENVETRIDISNYNPVQKRIFGYMAERLFNVWIEANKLKKITVPIIKITDNETTISPLHRLFLDLRYDLANFLVTPFYRKSVDNN